MDPTKLFEDITWADLTIFEDELKAVWEFDINMLNHKDLQTVCCWLNIKGVKNAQKRQCSRSLFLFTRSRKDMARLQTIATRKEPPCPYRSMNILFSDRFIESFVQLGNVADRAALDAGMVSNSQLFWQRVHEAGWSLQQYALWGWWGFQWTSLHKL